MKEFKIGDIVYGTVNPQNGGGRLLGKIVRIPEEDYIIIEVIDPMDNGQIKWKVGSKPIFSRNALELAETEAEKLIKSWMSD